MNTWYIPITILPGIALLILSTSNILIALSNEIADRIKQNIDPLMTKRKLSQLNLLTKGLVGLYVGAGSMVIAGILAGIQNFIALTKDLATVSMLIGTISLFISIGFLITFSFKAVRIRQDQFNESIN
ncbi:hypothetical protein GWK08_14230 [Leptobacterium flavescens]|uniref:DUF2721 domain-containing protein n=1 Tax=Leptobacterium flavescens TaxID=472055 RepID=A0A6P0US34_9FLAO|nr:hypothetical protein [Leptobacterium flavescens]NER14609.1 hypothetical protein [Leptobacterium flavescens]